MGNSAIINGTMKLRRPVAIKNMRTVTTRMMALRLKATASTAASVVRSQRSTSILIARATKMMMIMLGRVLQAVLQLRQVQHVQQTAQFLTGSHVGQGQGLLCVFQI